MPYYEYRLKNGQKRYYVQIWYRNVRHKKKGFRTKDAAKIYERNCLDRIDAGIFGTLPGITFEEYREKWLKQRSDLKPSTLDTYKSILESYSEDLDYLKLEDITPAILRGLLDRCESPKTKLNHLTIFRTMFKDAVNDGFIRESPAENIKRPRIEHEEMNYLDAKEARKLIKVCKGREKPLIMTAILTGMRRGELFGLKWEDVDFKEDYINIRRSKYRGQDVTPKSRYARRKIPIGPELKAELSRWKKESNSSPYVFTFDPDNFYKREFTDVLKRAKLRPIRFHDLRHTFAALMISQGENPKFLQKVMGHESFKTTMDTYGHLYPAEHAEAATRLESQIYRTNSTPSKKAQKKQAR